MLNQRKGQFVPRKNSGGGVTAGECPETSKESLGCSDSNSGYEPGLSYIRVSKEAGRGLDFILN